MVSSNLTCGMFDSLFIGTELTKGIKWGSNETAPFATTSAANIIFKERDYDKDATPLYKAMEWQQWSKVNSILKDKSVNVEQANTWTFRREQNDKEKIRWRMTALHSALVLKAPVDVIKGLLRLSPQSASCRDDQGMLPIHLAFRNSASDEIIYELLVVYPLGVDIKDKKGRIPLNCGVSQDTESFRWKVLGTYSAMVKLGRKREKNEAEGTNKKLTKVKKLYEQELDHLNEEYESKIEECSSQITSFEQQISAQKRTIKDITTDLNQERHKIQLLIKELNAERVLKNEIEEECDVIKHDAMEATEEKERVFRQYNKEVENGKILQKKVQDLEDELFDWRNSLFGGSIRSLFFCENVAK